MKKIEDHPDFQDWTIEKGRLECFNLVKKHLEQVENIHTARFLLILDLWIVINTEELTNFNIQVD